MGVLAEESGVQEDVEDFLLGELPLDADRQNPLLELAHQGSVPGQEVLPGDLLGDGAAALLGLAGVEDEQQDGPQRALVVDARMLEKAVVLGRQHRLDDHRRHVLQGNRRAPFAELGDQPPVAAVDGQRNLNPDVPQLFGLGKSRRHIEVASGDQRGDGEQPGAHEGAEGGREPAVPAHRRALAACRRPPPQPFAAIFAHNQYLMPRFGCGIHSTARITFGSGTCGERMPRNPERRIHGHFEHLGRF